MGYDILDEKKGGEKKLKKQWFRSIDNESIYIKIRVKKVKHNNLKQE